LRKPGQRLSQTVNADPAAPETNGAGPAPSALSPGELFNGYVGANVIFALREIGALQILAEHGRPISPGDLAAATQSDPILLRALLRAAELLGYATVDAEGVALAPPGREVVQAQGFFTWVIGGYADFLRALGAMASNRRAFGVDVSRDEEMVAVGAAEVDSEMLTEQVHAVLQNLDFAVLADVGCGNAQRLVQICRSYPGVTGIGIDVSEEACAIARRTVSAAGLESRIDIVCADIGDYMGRRHLPEYLTRPDLIVSFFMLHELFGREGSPATVMQRFVAAFPNARHFVIGDTLRRDFDETGRRLPIFSLAFELVHTFMGVELETLAAYEASFGAAGLLLEEQRALAAPSSWLFHLRPLKWPA